MSRQIIRTRVSASFDEPQDLRLLVMIPAFNEEQSIGNVLKDVRRAQPDADILVINDGSVDATSQIARGYGAYVLDQPFNLGIGSTMQTGFIYARDNGYDVAFQVDGDGQHDPEELKDLLDALRSHNVDVAIGSRYIEDRGYVTPWMRRIGIILLSAIISQAIRQKISDPTSGFRAWNRRAIHFCASDYPFDYPEPESIVTLSRAGLKIVEIPVTMHPRYGGQSSITPVRSAYYMVKVILSVFINLLREKPRPVGEVYRAAR